MPLLAFVIWLFHGKRRWLYFDHAIFTLHHFSFIMLVFTLTGLAKAIVAAVFPGAFIGISGIITSAATLSWILY